ncbi:GNAT family N-acetyltransferase [Methylobacterium sp. WL64]|uniref:GNAT family N-acetyltransferase n=1 Tax=Methylobacterium sp. WL64 TaxID=2603894 RepID=UPI0011CC3145|nr:GNAT family protein [Methylobacterium sp. WL64]TXN04918.1 GNAT family N-acetyltransferase [Methylobacterium sp. WL64]
MINFETERLEVRKFRCSDAAALLDYLHHPSARCFLSLALSDLDAAKAEARKRGDYDGYLAVCLKSSGQLIGDVFGIAEGAEYVDQTDTFAVGWNINPRFGNTGYGGEAARGLFANLFEMRNARRLYAYVDEGNVASERLCESLGMRPEGLFKEYISFVDDERGQPVFENTKQYALLRDEWTAVRS